MKLKDVQEIHAARFIKKADGDCSATTGSTEAIVVSVALHCWSLDMQKEQSPIIGAYKLTQSDPVVQECARDSGIDISQLPK